MDIPIYNDNIFKIQRHYNCDKSKKPYQSPESDEETIKKQIKWLISDLRKCIKKEKKNQKKK